MDSRLRLVRMLKISPRVMGKTRDRIGFGRRALRGVLRSSEGDETVDDIATSEDILWSLSCVNH